MVAAGAALTALLITFIAWSTLYRSAQLPYALEFSIHVSEPASTQVYFDFGAGLVESHSSSRGIQTGENSVRLPLPEGTYSGLRFDPIDRGGAARVGELRIVGPRGTVVRRIAPTELQPNPQIAESNVANGVLRMISTPAANDPQFTITFDPKLVLEQRSIDRLIVGRWWLLSWFGGSFAFVLVVQSTRRRPVRAQRALALARARPHLALALCAGFAAIASSYPVVFFGKSYLSPNTSQLLYNHLPSVPGYTDTQVEDARGADVGAMLWQHFPYTVQQSETLKAGTLPLWNRYASCGVTLIGQGQSMLGDPLHFLVVLTGGASWAFDLKFILMKALFGCGLGWCVWALTRDLTASAILAFGSVFIAFFNYRINHPSIFTMGYAPWILVAWCHLTMAVDRRAFRNALILWYLANWMMITSGTVKEAYILALSLNATGALIFFTAPASAHQKIQRGSILALAATAFILTTSPLWRSFLDALSSAYTSYNAPGIGQIPGQLLVGFFDDLFYRSLSSSGNVYKPAINFLLLLGCLWAVFQPRRLFAARGPFIVLVGGLASICLAFRFGPPTWAPSWVLAVPFLRNVHSLNTIFSCVAMVHFGVLAGWGFSAARQPLATHQAGRYNWMMAGAVLALFIPYFVIAPPAPFRTHEWPGWSAITIEQALIYAQVIMLPLAGWLLMRIAARHLRGSPLTFGAAAVAALALVVLLGRHGQHLPMPTTYIAAPGPRADLRTPSPAVEFLQDRIEAEPGRIQGLDRTLFTGFAAIYGFEVINGTNALENQFQRQFAVAAGLVTTGDWVYDLSRKTLPASRPILDFLNVRYLAESENLTLSPNGYRPVASLDLNILESEHAWPRAFFTDQLERYATPADLVRRITDDGTQAPFAAMQDGDPMPSFPGLPDDTTGSAKIVPGSSYELSTNTTAFTIVAPKAGVAVLHENWLADDFVATLNGKPVPYFRVNHAFKGVVIPESGSHRIEFAYSPRGFMDSLAAAALGLGLIIASLFATRAIPWPEGFSATPNHGST